MKNTRCCAYCIFAKVEFTPKMRVRKNSSARCTAEVPIPEVPASVLIEFHRTYMDPHEPRDDCQFYMAGVPGHR